nr:GGDEF domain-containing protein [Micromonospora sp. DSM 115978]
MRDVRVRDCDGIYQWFDVHARDLSQDRNVRGLLLSWSEVGDRKRLQDALARQAHYDPLTGLPNRSELERRLAVVENPPGDSGKSALGAGGERTPAPAS